MTKDRLIESIRQLILKQQATNDSVKFVHPAVIEAEIEKAYNTIVKQFYDNDLRLSETEFDFYCKKYTCLLFNESYQEENEIGELNTIYTGKRYAILPAKPVEFKRNLGIRSVKAFYGDYPFIRSSEQEIDSIKDMEVFCCSKNIFYYIDADKLMFISPFDDFNVVERVHVKLIPRFDQIEDTDDIEIPGGDNLLVQQVLQLMGIRPTDNTNDDVR